MMSGVRSFEDGWVAGWRVGRQAKDRKGAGEVI
jgi:hypothetical protein